MTDKKARQQRFYNLVQFYRQVAREEGEIAECGCWCGLSSYLLCHYAKKENPLFRGEGYHIFDSFEGLPEPTAEDGLTEERSRGVRGKFSARLEDVRTALSEFPYIYYHPGWIPQTFEGEPERLYKFVHVDVDLYHSTKSAVEYFYPRLISRGILVCDDYASPGWPGAKRAIEEFCHAHQLSFLSLSTEQVVLMKPYAERAVKVFS